MASARNFYTKSTGVAPTSSNTGESSAPGIIKEYNGNGTDLGTTAEIRLTRYADGETYIAVKPSAGNNIELVTLEQ